MTGAGCAAARGGHLKVLKYLQEQELIHHPPVGLDLADYAVLNGHLEVLKYLREHGCCITKAAINAHITGHPKVFQAMPPSHALNALALVAAVNGHLEILKYLREQGCSIDGIAIAAAVNGHLEVLKYLQKHSTIKIDKTHIADPEVLEYLRSQTRWRRLLAWLVIR
jgi:ankyrin repeat protein